MYWTEAMVLGLEWLSRVQGGTKCIGLGASTNESGWLKYYLSKNSLGNTWMVLGVYIRSGRSYESWGMSHSGVQ